MIRFLIMSILLFADEANLLWVRISDKTLWKHLLNNLKYYDLRSNFCLFFLKISKEDELLNELVECDEEMYDQYEHDQTKKINEVLWFLN